MRLEITCLPLIYRAWNTGLLLTRVLAMPTHPSNLYPTLRHAIIGFTRGRLSTLCLQGDANFGNAYVSNRRIFDTRGL